MREKTPASIIHRDSYTHFAMPLLNPVTARRDTGAAHPTRPEHTTSGVVAGAVLGRRDAPYANRSADPDFSRDPCGPDYAWFLTA